MPVARLDLKAPVSNPSVAANTNLGQLIARPFQTTSPTASGIEAPENGPLSAGGHTGNAASSQVPVPLPLSPVKAPLAAVTPDQSITYFPTVCLAPLYPSSISYITQYQTVTVTATSNSTSSSTFNPDTTFHLSVVTIAPTGASTPIAAPCSKSGAGND